jgi:hypothetical protein
MASFEQESKALAVLSLIRRRSSCSANFDERSVGGFHGSIRGQPKVVHKNLQ